MDVFQEALVALAAMRAGASSQQNSNQQTVGE